MVLSRPSHNRLKQQLLAGKLRKSATTGDLGYHTMVGNGSSSSNNSTMETVSAASSSTDLWDVRATKTAIRDLHILTHNAKHTPVSRRATSRATTSSPIVGGAVSYFDFMPDGVIVKVLSFLNSNQIILCSRVSRRFYFLAWEPELWREIALTGGSGGIDADLALRTIMRLLARNSSSSPAQTASNKLPCVESLSLGGCQRLTDRGLAIVARRCPQLRRLEVQYCGNITNGGIMDLVTKCTYLDQLDVSGECSAALGIEVLYSGPVSGSGVGFSDFFCDSRSGLGSRKKRNRNLYRGVIILVQGVDPESNFQPFCDSGS